MTASNSNSAATRAFTVVVLNPGTHPELAYLAAALHSKGALACYITSGSWGSGSKLAKTVGNVPALSQHLRRRRLGAEIPDHKVVRFGVLLEILFVALQRLPPAWHTPVLNLRTRWVDFRASVLVRKLEPSAVVGQSTGFASTLKSARAVGATTILNCPLPHHIWMAGFLSDDLRRSPEWGEYLQHARLPPRLRQRLDRELALADKLLVASTFVEETYRELLPFAQIASISLGAHSTSAGHEETKSAQDGENLSVQLRVIYAGQITQRKGISYLLAAIDSMRRAGSQVSLTLVGKPYNRMDQKIAREYPWVDVLPSVPRAALFAEYLKNDVFVFPTLVDGFGLVVVEAMAHGLPVVVSRNSLGPDVVRDKVDGYLISAGSINEITESLQLLVDDPATIRALGRNARRRAEEYTWERYQSNVCRLLEDGYFRGSQKHNDQSIDRGPAE